MNNQKNFNRIISNNVYFKKKKYALIIGETPSKGARSPKLWNKVYKKYKEHTEFQSGSKVRT